MRRFGRVTCCGGETRLLFRFAHLQHWMAMMPPNSTSNCAVLLSARYQCCMSSLAHLYIYSNHLIYSRLTHWAPPRMSLSMCTAAHWGMLQHNELCTPWHICLFCFSAIFSNYVCCWIYSRYSRALFSQVCLTACQGAKTGAKRIGWDGLKSWLSVTARLGVFAFPRWLCAWSIYTQKRFCCHIKK